MYFLEDDNTRQPLSASLMKSLEMFNTAIENESGALYLVDDEGVILGTFNGWQVEPHLAVNFIGPQEDWEAREKELRDWEETERSKWNLYYE